MNFIKLLIKSTLAIGMLVNIVNAKEVNFEGKTIEWTMPFKAGGGTDKWGRFYAPLLSKALPGNPVVVIKNMPGGGSTKGANFFAQRASKDGLSIFAASGSTQFPYLLDDRRVRYDYKKWEVVLASPTGGVVYIPSSLGVKTVKDLKNLKTTLKFGSQGATSLDLIPLLAFHILGLDVEPIFGMKGRKSGRLAFLRGETTIDYQTSTSYIKNVMPTIKNGNIVPLFSWGVLDEDGNLQRDPTFPNLPHFGEVYESIYGKKPSGSAFSAWKSFFTAGFSVQKMILLPKGVSKDVLETYQKAVKKVLNDENFKKLKTANLGIYDQAIGEKARKLKDLGTKVSKEDRQWIKNWLKESYNIRF
ncbi:tricarboxylate transporter [Malaciobacter molluscorum LMG 25693]|uniref:Tricarboxylate transporter n=1 Tax=Malaciobacter molluscorum LMG 25693 TaxID=870501 RepID=A0A2G1DLY4_9BACT|nr:tricarboxylate transporter [Malaciobacter molluscorum]AXX92165.1 tripartite tricarboxylate transport protein TctABC, extracytoplasmic tricarboxylate-binding receptor TctC [Malaciobacter molluscorum LMG 25693]PHO19394.1 tricarboxylate transporter [Malaciobacter molluscorum LMG 25693]